MRTKTTFFLPLAIFFLVGYVQAQTLDTTTFVVMGEGLAAGMANFGLSSVMQNQDFAALLAAQMNTGMEQPLIQPPGIGDVVGYPGQEVVVQRYPQGAVRQSYLPTDPTKAPISTPPIFVTNVSVPGQTLNDSITLKPVAPVVQRGNMKQTVFNMILGYPQLILNVPLWTQLEYAENLNPTVVLVELGYYEALEAAVAGDPTLMPNPAAFGATYGKVIAGLRGVQAQVIVTTIPNPLDTGYFNSVTAAANIVQAMPSVLTAGFLIAPQDYITRNGLQSISNTLATLPIPATVIPPSPGELSHSVPPGTTLSAATAAAITNSVNALNAQIVNAAKTNGAVVYDLNAFLHKVKVSGARAGTATVSGDYLGGFYSLDGIYPGATGHALIANDILTFLNQTYHRNFAPVNVSAVSASDPAGQYVKPQGELFSPSSLGIGGE